VILPVIFVQPLATPPDKIILVSFSPPNFKKYPLLPASLQRNQTTDNTKIGGQTRSQEMMKLFLNKNKGFEKVDCPSRIPPYTFYSNSNGYLRRRERVAFI
jgi:hypothetical protein